MNRRTKIKIIKKDEIKFVETPEVPEKKSERSELTEAASAVSGWISEFQERRREETDAAFLQFYS